jgi:CPA1 family monovalent cation:H+ antiporter
MDERVVDRVGDQYEFWKENARRKLDSITELYPEFVTGFQERLGERLILFSEAEAVAHDREKGLLPHSMAERMQEKISGDLAALRGVETSKLKAEPSELLRKVPFFEGIPEDQFSEIAAKLRAHTYSENELVFQQNAKGDSLFLIARGVVRVSRKQNGTSRDLATLMAGDFFGEMALVLKEPRTATIRAVTPCSLYELRRTDLESVTARYPSILRVLDQAARKRQEEQRS